MNGGAANSLTGISHFTNSISARQRWALSHSLCSKIISKTLEEIGITKKDDTIHELQAHRIKKDRIALEIMKDSIKKNINLFDGKLDNDNLFHLVTGRAASEETASFRLNVNELGEQEKMKFIEDCNNNPERFKKPIKRITITNFAYEYLKKTLKNRQGDKQVLLKTERDIFGRLLTVALEKKIDL